VAKQGIADPFKTDGGRKMESGVAPLSRFLPYPQNPRTHPPEMIAFLAYLLKRYGPDQPIVVDENWIIVKGHGRRESALQAGLEEFPYVRRLDLSEAEKIAMRIDDNQSALLSGWNIPLVHGEIGRLKGFGYDINRLGFGQAELVQFTTTPGPENGGAPAGGGLGSLADRFGVVPFSVLNAREGWWQDRKRAWLALGIQSELGRGENLLKFRETLLEPDPAKRGAKADAKTFGTGAAAKGKNWLYGNDKPPGPKAPLGGEV
jgi:hypothetical protein